MLLTACAALREPPAAPLDAAAHQRHLQALAKITHFSLSGRMGVQTRQKGFSGKFQWTHAPGHDRLAFFTPLGSQVAEIVANSDHVTLTGSDRKTYTAQDIETLLEQTMGWSMPVSGLTDWALGRPTSEAYDNILWDDQGRLTHLQQQQWRIEYATYVQTSGNDLPGKIVLKSPQLDLKLIVDQWQIAP